MCFGVHCLSLAVTVFHIPDPSNLSNSHFQMPVLQYVLYKLTRQTEANETAYPLPSWHSSFLLKPLFQLPFRALWLNITELILANLSQKGDYIRIMLSGSNQQKKMSPPAQGQYQVGSGFQGSRNSQSSQKEHLEQQYHRLVLTVLKCSSWFTLLKI